MLKTDHCYDADMWKHMAKLQTDGESVVPADDVRMNEKLNLFMYFEFSFDTLKIIFQMDAIFEEVLKKSPLDPALKSSYLDWIIARNDIKLTRDVFLSVSRTPPYDINLYRKMIHVEMSQPERDVKRIRELFTMACLYFGSAHTGIVKNKRCSHTYA